jgi:drug/metabolite transporter (DMT)-like permease
MTATPAARSGDAVPARVPMTSRGLSAEAFTPTDWGLLATTALVFGSSFLFMEIGLRSLAPAVITLARLGLGALTLWLIPRTRRTHLEPSDARRAAAIGVIWLGIPLMLFPFAQQWIDSSVAGMINGSMPLWTVLWTAVLARDLPRRIQALGLGVGFVGIVLVSLPELPTSGLGDERAFLGVLMALLAAFLYGLSATLITPLQQRYGSLAVMSRAQLGAIAVVLPFALVGLRDSTFSWPSVLAMVPLGVLGSAVAFVAVATLIGRVGAPRGAISIYFVPIVAVVLGVVLLGERVHPLALAGTALVILGAWLTSRREAAA